MYYCLKIIIMLQAKATPCFEIFVIMLQLCKHCRSTASCIHTYIQHALTWNLNSLSCGLVFMLCLYPAGCSACCRSHLCPNGLERRPTVEQNYICCWSPRSTDPIRKAWLTDRFQCTRTAPYNPQNTGISVTIKALSLTSKGTIRMHSNQSPKHL